MAPHVNNDGEVVATPDEAVEVDTYEAFDRFLRQFREGLDSTLVALQAMSALAPSIGPTLQGLTFQLTAVKASATVSGLLAANDNEDDEEGGRDA